ncbi:MAG: protein kinase domain-containing protein [Planctomycetota bacterium]|jgi:serine/threonine-protein kinase
MTSLLAGGSLLRARKRLGKYRIERLIGQGGFASVYQARDTIEGILVALKIFKIGMTDSHTLQLFRQEVRLNSRLDHPNILPIKDANVIDGHFVIVSRLGDCTLADRMTSRMAVRTVLDYGEQILAALSHAHEHRVIHCDVKPENFILFRDGTLKLTDFGIARFALRTVQGSGSGTVGFVAPEQAMGRPSYRSDVFSTGLILYRMFSGQLPEWPFDWPPPGHEKIRRNLHKDLVSFLQRSISVSPQKRFRDCCAMLAAFEKLQPKALRRAKTRRRKKATTTNGRHWREVRFKQFNRLYRKHLDARHTCRGCKGPISEAMRYCPWCKRDLKIHRGDTRVARKCPRCKRGMKPDWRFCGWCFGKSIPPATNRSYTDKRYEGRCASSSCSRKQLMPFMRYCPWCRTKVRRRWKIAGNKHKCSSCGWGVVRDYWKCCPWCSKTIHR